MKKFLFSIAFCLKMAFTPVLASDTQKEFDILDSDQKSQTSYFRDCHFCPEMVLLPPGSFVMGSSEEEQQWAANNEGSLWHFTHEAPQHLVRISSPFAMSRYEITRDQFEIFLKETGHTPDQCHTRLRNLSWVPDATKNWENPGFTQTANHPVVCVSHADAKAYAHWLSEKTGRQYRLPSEAEWEYAARAGSAAFRYWGSDKSNQLACRYANVTDAVAYEAYPGNWHPFDCRDGFLNTAPIGTYEANSFGLHDMLGNVREWTADCYSDSYHDVPSDGRAVVFDICQQWVSRGGHWGSLPRDLRSASRSFGAPNGRGDHGTGFRVVASEKPLALLK